VRLSFHAISDDADGRAWQALFRRLWPAYQRWYLQEGVSARPTYVDCRRALVRHMPQWVATWERLVDLAGGGDLAARFLSLYEPPPYLSACSQAVWPGEQPLLVRNYDYAAHAFDATCLRTTWGGRAVLGTSDCLVGLVDGMNDAGLAVSLTFGGRRDVGSGFGVPLILRYLLQTCDSTPDARRALADLPSHMAYNITVVDARRDVCTAYLTPGQTTVLTHTPVATNHQNQVDWVAHARMTATVERERFLLQRLMLHEDAPEQFVAAFLRPPLYSLAFDRGFGTLYTAAYRPTEGRLTYHWPHYAWDLQLAGFEPSGREVQYPVAPVVPAGSPRPPDHASP
jgi:predicted choloylglycine hydrolase